MQTDESTVAATDEKPKLHLKAKRRSGRLLNARGEGSQFATLREALEFIDKRRGNDVLIVTRMPTGWAIHQYRGSFLCKLGFKDLQIAGLPLGGDPLTPHTYIVDSRGRLAQIVRQEDRYELKPATRPTEEPTGPWINAIVPVEEHNDGKYLTWLPSITLCPSLDELQTMQTWINQNLQAGTKIKAGGSKHAWSPISNTNSVYIRRDHMNLFQSFDKEPNVYRDDIGERRRNFVRIGSGEKIRDANKYLWNHGKSFFALGGYDAQSMGGVFNTGTHGSVFTIGPLAESIVSIDLLRPNATFVRIEPSDGITDPSALSKEVPNLELIQNDDYFYANLINMGTMGIVHSYVLEVTDRYHMEEVRTAMKVDDLKGKLKGGKIYELAGVKGVPAELEKQNPKISNGKDGGFEGHPYPAFHLEFLFNPHGTNVVVTSRRPKDVSAKADSEMGFEPPGRDLVRTILMGSTYSSTYTRPPVPTWFQERYRRLVVCIFDTFSHAFPKSIPWLISQAMGTLPEKHYENRSFNVYNIGEGTNRIPAFSGTIFIPLENDMYLEALDIILATAKDLAAKKLYETAPVSMRFIKGTKALIGCPKDSCGFECVFTASTTYALKVFEAYVDALRKKFGDEVRLHWGQMLPDFTPEQIRGMYPQYDRWRTIRDQLDPEARYLNDWQVKNLPPVA